MDSSGSAEVSILLVEDCDADVDLICMALQEHSVRGHLVVMTDGEKAIEYIGILNTQSLPCPDLVILDLNLPKRNGREVLAAMRSSSACSRVPLIVLSSSDAERDRLDAMHSGADEYLCKPSDLRRFLALGAVFKSILSKARPAE